MSNELTTTPQQETAPAPFSQQRAGLPAVVNAGAVAIESERAIAEARGQMQLAKMFPRDNNAAYAELMESCKLPAMAAVAFYSVPRGGKSVTGPSIRLAEEIVRCYGNIEYGHRELSRSIGKSEVEVFVWDKEKNNRRIRQITVEHVMDTRDGPRKLRDQKDIDDKISNVVSKQVRGLILSMMPKWMVQSAIEECQKTISGNNTEPLSVRVRKMTQAFAAFGVTAEHLERHLGHKLDDVLADELVDLTGIYNAIKEGEPASEYFKASTSDADGSSSTAEGIKAAASKGAAAKAASASQPAPQAAAPAAAPAAAQPAAQPAQAAAAPVSNPAQKNSKAVKESPAPAPVETPPPASEQQNQTGGPADDEHGGDVF